MDERKPAAESMPGWHPNSESSVSTRLSRANKRGWNWSVLAPQQSSR